MLPVFGAKNKIVNRIRNNSVVIVVGQTASGKTTQVPQMVLDSKLNNGKLIAITQPRRIAAISLAKRVAEERKEVVGRTVGYAVRFEEMLSPKTVLKFVTDGLLVKEVQSDPDLSKYSVIILDEVHERTINTDMLLSVVNKVSQDRNEGSKKHLGPLKVVIMSATLDMRQLSDLFPNSSGVIITPRHHNIDLMNITTLQEEYVSGMISKICDLHNTEPIDNHILAFVPGREEITTIVTVLKSYNMDKLIVLPLYSALSHDAQLKAICKTQGGYRRVVVSTNIAETSLTIPGISIVLDSGYVKRKVILGPDYEALQVQRISKAEAYQRSGRAGRESDGVCYRFYTNEDFRTFNDFPQPEMEHASITKMLLMVLSLGEKFPSQWPWLQQPSLVALKLAKAELLTYGAITTMDEPIELTEAGREIALAPVDAKYATILLLSLKNKLFHDVSAIIAVLSSEPFIMIANEAVERKREHFHGGDGDLLTYLRIMKAFKSSKHKKEFCHTYKFSLRPLQFASKVRKQLYKYASQSAAAGGKAIGTMKSDNLEMSEQLRRLFVTALPCNVAILEGDNVYRTRRSGKESIEVKVHPNSSLIGKKCKVVHFLEITRLGGVNYMSHVSPIDSFWAPTLFPVPKHK